ncbi:unnamed protein product [Ectocarpus sp. CCAP 1310/34]|nr:unnamed protein product [Ectocarpus sp. CCAP 1310/34]
MAGMEGSFTDLRSTREVLDLLNNGGESVLWEVLGRDISQLVLAEPVVKSDLSPQY